MLVFVKWKFFTHMLYNFFYVFNNCNHIFFVWQVIFILSAYVCTKISTCNFHKTKNMDSWQHYKNVFRFMWPCITNAGEERTNRWHRYRCLFTISLISTCFGYHYAHCQENRLYKTPCGVCLQHRENVKCSVEIILQATA